MVIHIFQLAAASWSSWSEQLLGAREASPAGLRVELGKVEGDGLEGWIQDRPELFETIHTMVHQRFCLGKLVLSSWTFFLVGELEQTETRQSAGRMPLCTYHDWTCVSCILLSSYLLSGSPRPQFRCSVNAEVRKQAALSFRSYLLEVTLQHMAQSNSQPCTP